MSFQISNSSAARILAAHSRPSRGGIITPKKREGAGKAGSSPPPWPACEKECTRRLPQVRPRHPGLPCAMVYTVAPRSPRGPAFLPPYSRRCFASSRPRQCSRIARGISTGMPGPHDLAVRNGAFVRVTNHACTPSRPTAPRTQRIVTTRTSLCMRRDGRQDAADLGSVQSGLFFAENLDRGDGIDSAEEFSF
jgi:hypothetical protein